MALKERIQADLNSFLKEKNSLAATTLRTLLSSLTNKEKESGGSLSDEDALSVVEREVKMRRESTEAFVKGGRPELAEREQQELTVLMRYLPEQLSVEQVQKLIEDAVALTGALEIKDMGRVMAELNPKIKGKADGAKVSSLVKEILLK